MNYLPLENTGVNTVSQYITAKAMRNMDSPLDRTDASQPILLPTFPRAQALNPKFHENVTDRTIGDLLVFVDCCISGWRDCGPRPANLLINRQRTDCMYNMCILFCRRMPWWKGPETWRGTSNTFSCEFLLDGGQKVRSSLPTLS